MLLPYFSTSAQQDACIHLTVMGTWTAYKFENTAFVFSSISLLVPSSRLCQTYSCPFVNVTTFWLVTNHLLYDRPPALWGHI